MLEKKAILIVDDHPLVRRGIRQLLELDPLFHVIGEAGDGHEAIALATKSSPDLILLDLNMKGLSGVDTLKELRKIGLKIPIIIFTVSDSRHHIYTVIDAGADGYLLKDSEPELLLSQITHAVHGKRVFSQSVRECLNSRHEQKDLISDLTRREIDILKEVARGMSNKQIASRLYISEETVKVHIRNMLRKLDVRSRVAAAVMYLDQRSGFYD